MKHIMIQGTGSNVGKSVIVAGLCRYFVNKGFKVAPFKAQNMALNSGVTFDGFEIGRAQIFQAEAAKLFPDVRMNPILLKPTKAGFSQVIRMGKPFKTVSFKDYYTLFRSNFKIIKHAFESLEKEFDFLIIEGAGSPAEINLQKFDMVNMRVAKLADANVFIVGDIDRGGVFASFKGTYDLIEEKYKKYVKGFVINKFRGDLSLLEPAFKMFKKYCQIPIIGVVPFFNQNFEEEDSQIVFKCVGDKKSSILKVAVIKLAFMSNFTDFLPLCLIDEVYLEYIDNPKNLIDFDVIIIPGSKNSIQDLRFLYEKGFATKIKKLVGEKVIVGICGGFQMLGKKIIDREGIEERGEINGMAILDLITEFDKEKILTRKNYKSKLLGEISGYEIHHGLTKIMDSRVIDMFEDKGKLIVDYKRKIIGTYLHGIFENSNIIKLLGDLAEKKFNWRVDYKKSRDKQLDEFAKLIGECIEMDKLWI